MTKKKTSIQLRTWIFDKPVKFALWMLICVAIAWLPVIFPSMNKPFFMDTPMLLIMLAVFIFGAYRLIKTLPLYNINQKDFVAIINGFRITTVFTVLFLLISGIFMHFLIPSDVIPANITPELMKQISSEGIIVSRFVFDCFTILRITISMYVLGLIISSICIKYKRARVIGFSPWQIILSMPFTFVMAWMPGYLTDDTNQQSNLDIQSKWYMKFNNWVLKTKSNTYFMFIFLIIFSNILFTHDVSVFLFPLSLLMIYAIWKQYSQQNLKQQMCRNYAYIMITINIIMLFLAIYIINQKYHVFNFLYFMITKG